MPYTGPATKGIRQEFSSCYTKATASYGMGMAWTFPSPTGVAGARAEVTTSVNVLGYWANPVWDRVLVPWAGVAWNHERVALPDRECLLISRGYVPDVLVDNRGHAGAGNNWPINLGDLVPNVPIGMPNSGGYTTITFDDGVMWPQYRVAGTEWLLLNVHMVCLDTLTVDTTGTIRAFLGHGF
jgi:hypothetical protein